MKTRTSGYSSLALGGALVLAGLILLAAATWAPRPASYAATPLDETETPTPSQIYLPLLDKRERRAPRPVINEVLYWPEQGDAQWVEIYNAASQAQNLSGWVLANGLLTDTVALPSWTMPPGSYLLVRFAAGSNEPDFFDGAATFHAPRRAPFLAVAEGGAALYSGAPAVATLVDAASLCQ